MGGNIRFTSVSLILPCVYSRFCHTVDRWGGSEEVSLTWGESLLKQFLWEMFLFTDHRDDFGDGFSKKSCFK